MITVVIVDDQDVVRTGLRALLTRGDRIRVVGEATYGRRGVESALRHRPDVVLMDLRMPVIDGIAATKAIRAEPALERTRVVVLTTFDDDDQIVEALRAGAVGYLLKDTTADRLREVVIGTAAGEQHLSPAVMRRMMDLVARGRGRPVPDPRLERLTERELEVLRQIGLGATNDEIAATLHLSPATARTYVSRILGKLEARDRPELVVLAHRSGLVDR